MDLEKENPGGQAEASKNCACGGRCKQVNNPISTPKNQAIRLPSATRYFLNRYREDLQSHAQAGDKIAASMLECCDFLLIESARVEGSL